MGKRKRVAGKPYTGVLARPIRFIPFEPKRTFATLGRGPEAWRREIDAEIKRVSDAHTDAIIAKLPALFAHYGVSEGDFCTLAVAIAIKHVPGFTMASAPPGRKKRWDQFRLDLLRFHVEYVKAERPGRSFANAARLVARSGEWKSEMGPSANPGATLERLAKRGDPRWAKFHADAFASDAHQNSAGTQHIGAYVKRLLVKSSPALGEQERIALAYALRDMAVTMLASTEVSVAGE